MAPLSSTAQPHIKTLTCPLLKPSSNQAIVLLNTEWGAVHQTPKIVPSSPNHQYQPTSTGSNCWLNETLWNESLFRVCADGASNRLYHLQKQHYDVKPPDLICGDLDSIQVETRQFYENVKLVQDTDVNRNDLDKCLEQVQDFERVIVYGAFGGRFDQEMASFQALFCWRNIISELWLMDHQNMAFLLEPEVENRIEVGKEKVCGLIPLGQPCKSVTTSGLKWNLEGQSLEFGGLVSTSNHILDSTVTIRCSSPLIFTTIL